MDNSFDDSIISVEDDDFILALKELEAYEDELAEDESYNNKDNDLDDLSDLEPDLYEDLEDELEDIDF